MAYRSNRDSLARYTITSPIIPKYSFKYGTHEQRILILIDHLSVFKLFGIACCWLGLEFF
uniref:Uncharacterized protein n=1 Tax=Anopheles quadriannulatus TaxID=34691 RepID=A0A182XT98_ANOQN